jgi:hypothetical protein
MPDGRLRIADDVVFEVLEDETVVLNLTSGEYYTLNATGTRAWELLEAHAGDLDRVLEVMVAEFDVETDRLRADLDRLFRDLLERKLLAPAS